MRTAPLFLAGIMLELGQVALANIPSCYTRTEPTIQCNNTEGRSYILAASAIPTGEIPFPVWITSITIGDTTQPLVPGDFGIWEVWLDPGGRFAKLNPNFPAEQKTTPGMSLLAQLDLQAGLPVHSTRDLTQPIAFDSSDALIIDMPCGHSTSMPDFSAQMYWTICWTTTAPR